jgi:phospholipase D-like protein
MEGLAAAVVAIAILLGALLLVAFIVFCLVKVNTADEVRFLPRWAWSILVVCVSPLGGVVYLLSQHVPAHSPRRA